MTTPDRILDSLADFQSWKQGRRKFDLIDYAMCTATPDSLCAFLELVDPLLIKHDGHFFLAHQFDLAAYEAWHVKLDKISEIQKVMNHIHISSLVQDQEVGDGVALHIAQRLAGCWSRTFQHLGLKAECYGSCLDDAQVTFFTATDGA